MWLLVRLLGHDRERLWLVVGVVVGVGFLNKHTVVFVGVGLVAGLLLGGRTRQLRSPWLWAGAAIAAAIALPNVVWHAQHEWPVFEMLDSLQQESEPADSLLFLPAQLGATATTAVVWLPGLVWLLRSRDAERVRPLGFAYVTLVVIFIVTSAKPYYLAGMYPALLAAGGVVWERRGRVAVPAAVVGVGAFALALAIPILPPARAARLPIEDLELEFGAQLGWERLVDHVGVAWSSLPAVDRDRAVIFTRNYGEAGAVDRFGPALGLPRAYSGHNNYWLWGPPKVARAPAIVVGYTPDELDGSFARCGIVWRFATPHGVASEEEGMPVTLCRTQIVDWDDLWPELRRYTA